MNPLAALIRSLGTSPAEAAALLDVPASLITSVLLGERPTIPLKLMFALAQQGFSSQQIASFCTIYDEWRYSNRKRTA